MTLHYKDLDVRRYYLSGNQPSRTLDEVYEYGMCGMDYDFEMSVSQEDITEYLIEKIGYSTFMACSSEYQKGFRFAINRGFYEDMFSEEDLQSNDDFVEWLKEKYKDKAQEQCHLENDEF